MARNENVPEGWSTPRRSRAHENLAQIPHNQPVHEYGQHEAENPPEADLPPSLSHRNGHQERWRTHRRQVSTSSLQSARPTTPPNREAEAARATNFALLQQSLAAESPRTASPTPRPTASQTPQASVNVFATGSLVEALAAPPSVVRNSPPRPLGPRRERERHRRPTRTASSSSYSSSRSARTITILSQDELMAHAANLSVARNHAVSAQQQQASALASGLGRGRQPFKTVQPQLQDLLSERRILVPAPQSSGPRPTSASPRQRGRASRQRQRVSAAVYPMMFAPRMRGIYYPVEKREAVAPPVSATS